MDIFLQQIKTFFLFLFGLQKVFFRKLLYFTTQEKNEPLPIERKHKSKV
jgi:hypothetical protein